MFLLFLLSLVHLQAQVVNDAWVKAVPPTLKMSASYMNITNDTKKTIKLVGAKSTLSEYVEIHTHKHENGVMKMRQIKEIAIKPGATHVLKPKSDHLMFIQLLKPLKVGSNVDIELMFSNGKKLNIKAPVKKLQSL